MYEDQRVSQESYNEMRMIEKMIDDAQYYFSENKADYDVLIERLKKVVIRLGVREKPNNWENYYLTTVDERLEITRKGGIVIWNNMWQVDSFCTVKHVMFDKISSLDWVCMNFCTQSKIIFIFIKMMNHS